MAINAVSSAAGTAAKSIQQPKAEARKAEAAQQDEKSPKSGLAAQKPEPAQPVMNAQGQKTGQIVNVTA